jgi:uncharacterized protein (TIGR03086 family)
MIADPTHQLSIALDATEQLIAAIADDQWTAPTPCAEWQVRDLVDHVVIGNQMFASILRGQPPAPRRPVPLPDADQLTAYRASATAVLEAFRQPGVLEQIFTVPMGTVPGMVALHLRITELLVHGWDLARATGQPTNFSPELAEQELAFTQATLPQVPAARSPFAPPQPVADSAPAIDRLAALLGRNVTKSAPPR